MCTAGITRVAFIKKVQPEKAFWDGSLFFVHFMGLDKEEVPRRLPRAVRRAAIIMIVGQVLWFWGGGLRLIHTNKRENEKRTGN